MAPNIVILGPAGAGKTTQVDQLVTHQKYHSISLGEFLRSEQFLRTPLGRRLTRLLNAGLLIDDFTANTILFFMIQQAPTGQPLVIDGYPRNPQQAKKLKTIIAEKKMSIDIVFELDLSFEQAAERIKSQAYNDKTGKDEQVSNNHSNHSNQLVIEDFTDEAILNRHQSYQHEISFVRSELDGWAQYITIDASKPQEEVTGTLFNQLNKFNDKIGYSKLKGAAIKGTSVS